MLNDKIPASASRSLIDEKYRFALLSAVVVLLAFLIREYFVLVAVVEIPIRGDVREYVKYAWNLQRHGVFSMAEPSNSTPVPDAYRPPGFPWLIALCMQLRPGNWYGTALQMQVLLGTATVWLTMSLARQWLACGWAIAAGMLLAIWPHHVAATGALLSEVAFGFMLTAGAYCLAKAFDSRHWGWLLFSALMFGCGYLVNPLIALFPPMIAMLVWHEKRRKAAAIFLITFLAPVLVWSLRSASLGDTSHGSHSSRAAINLVQGSWPQYHKAWQAQLLGDHIGMTITEEINKEIGLLENAPRSGVSAIATRMERDPAYYAAWYLWRKPLLLWNWDIRIGAGGFYFLVVGNSPFDTNLLLRVSSTALRHMNPLFSVLALGATVLLLVGGMQHRAWATTPAMATAALVFYLTAIHTVFQAEPRYANAYRGFEILVLLSMLQLLAASICKLPDEANTK